MKQKNPTQTHPNSDTNLDQNSDQSPTHPPTKSKKTVLILLATILVAVLIYGLYQSQQSRHAPQMLQGQMQLEQTNIGSKVAGRIAQILVSEGDQIQAGDPLITMQSPEIEAKIAQGIAALEMAQSQLDKANNGARPQEIAQAKINWQANQTAEALTQNTYQRLNRLYQEGLIARQKRDEAHTQYQLQKDKTEAARQQYDLAITGARPEDIEGATAQVAQVKAKLQEAYIAQEEANLKSPIAGIVNEVIVNAGEVVGQGVPLLTLTNPQKQWVSLNVTEDQLQHFGIGQKFTGTIPALPASQNPQTFTVYASSALADFATWRPSHQNTGFDMRTFEIKARPDTPNPNIRSGMSVLVQLDPKSIKHPHN